MQHVRIFAAVNLSVASIRALAKLQITLRDALGTPPPVRVRWVSPPNIHATVKFYGNLFEAQLPALVDAAREAAQGVRPFALVAKGLGAFPSPDHPRILWVGLRDGSDALAALRDRLEDASWALGFEREPRAFHGHVTLARISKGNADLSDLVAEHAEADGLVSTVEELVLYESRLHRAGAEYVARARIPLQGTRTFRKNDVAPVSSEPSAQGPGPKQAPSSPSGTPASPEAHGSPAS